MLCGLNLTSHAQVYTADPPELINDYISIGEFNTAGNAEGWGRNTGAIAPFVVANGELEVTTTGGDPWFFRVNFAGPLEVPTDFTLVQMRLKFLEGSRDGWEMFWGTTTRGGPVGGQSIGYSLGWDDAEYHIMQFDMSEQVADGSSIDDFRIDPGQGAGNRFVIDYVRVGKVSPDTDADGLPDTVETGTGVFVSARDTGTDPTKADTDGDTFNDGFEVSVGTDPNNKDNFPIEAIDRYTRNEAVYVVGVEIAPNEPIITFGTPQSFSVAPALPGGLTLNPTTGVITGTPTAAAPATEYTVTANFGGGKTDTEILNLTVRNPYIQYTLAKYTFRANLDVGTVAPTAFGTAPASYGIDPALPDGLAFDTATGAITGMGSAFNAPKEYTVTAKYTGFPDATFPLTLSVVEDPVPVVDPEQRVLDYVTMGEFDDPADAAGWFQNGIQTPFEVLDGALVIVTVGGDPFFGKNGLLAQDYRVIEVRMKVLEGSANPLRIYWSEDAPNRGYSEPTAFNMAAVVEDGEYHVYQMDLSKSMDGRFNGIRYDVGGGAGTTAHFDYIRIGTFLPRLSVEQQTDGSLRVSWAASAEGFKLQTNASLPGTWADYTGTVQTEGDRKVAVVQPTAAQAYYRLVQP